MRPEFTVSRWTFMAINQVEQRLAHYERSGQARLADLAIQYEGMGHFRVLAVDRKTGRLFQRVDGGANDYERDHNSKFIAALDLSALDAKYFHDFTDDLPSHTHVLVAPW